MSTLVEFEPNFHGVGITAAKPYVIFTYILINVDDVAGLAFDSEFNFYKICSSYSVF